MIKNKDGGLSRRAFVGVTAGAAGGALAAAAITLSGRRASALTSGAGHTGAATDAAADRTAHGMASAVERATDGSGVDEQVAPGAIAETSPAPWEMVRPLRAGAALADGWYLKDLSGVVAGACVLTLANRRGREQRVHLCRNQGRPQGLVYTERFDMVAMNGGRGDLPTEESFGQAVAVVAHAIAANEGRGAAGLDGLDGLLSQSDREERFAAMALLR